MDDEGETCIVEANVFVGICDGQDVAGVQWESKDDKWGIVEYEDCCVFAILLVEIVELIETSVWYCEVDCEVLGPFDAAARGNVQSLSAWLQMFVFFALI